MYAGDPDSLEEALDALEDDLLAVAPTSDAEDPARLAKIEQIADAAARA